MDYFMTRPLIIAHRGDSSRALENSLEAFRLALTVPADMIELDIRMSRDHQLFVMHDERTGRTCERDINIEKATAEEIAALRLRNGEPVPTLQDVLALAAGKAGLNLEIKSAGAGGLTAAYIAGSGYRGDILISSFKEREVLDARRVAPHLPVAGIFDAFSTSAVRAYRNGGCTFISLNRKTITRELLAALHETGIKAYVWTVDEEAEMQRLIEWGADGIYSNRPAVLKHVVDALGKGAP
jgi:glycerophosphoryl diester phosphodiesterase